MIILFKKEKGFSLLEVIVSIAIFSIIMLVIVSSLMSMDASNSKTFADREVSENGQRALEEMVYEIKSAKSIYTPTTTQNQLSLETSKYMPAGQTDTFIDFFLCQTPSGGSAICLKKESQTAITITPSSVNVTNLAFSQISTGSKSSIQINLTVSYSGKSSSSASLTSVASLRSY